MRINPIAFVGSTLLLGTLTTAMGQSFVNYQITALGNANSLVTWSVTGSLIGSPGVTWVDAIGNFGGVPIQTTGLYNASYAGISSPAAISSPDGSFYRNTELAQDYALNQYFAGVFGNTDIFGLVTAPATTADGQHLTFTGGTESVIIPIPYADFNPGTYQSSFAAGTFFDSTVTVNLTVGATPEPSTLALTAGGGLAALLLIRRRGPATVPSQS